MRVLKVVAAGVVWAVCCTPVLAGDYAGKPVVREFAQRVAKAHGLNAAEVEALLAKATKQQAILDAIARPAEKTKPWYEYRAIFLDEQRIDRGVAFWSEHESALARAEKVYGVPPAVIVAIIGVETRYGKVTGNYRVLDALTTLGFDYPPRAPFFSKELEHFLVLVNEQKQNPLLLKGSYAGAMGYGQFMPSSYRAYATDFDGDGATDIWNNPVDVIGSVANYFRAHGWQSGQQVMLQAKAAENYNAELVNQIQPPALAVKDLRAAGFTPISQTLPATEKVIPLLFESETGADFWFGLNNFYVITRYNRSPLYARAVWELSEAIKERRHSAASA